MGDARRLIRGTVGDSGSGVIRVRRLGRVRYSEALDLQRSLHSARTENRIPDYLLLLEHHPVFTLGRRADRTSLRLAPEAYQRLGAAIVETDRGGDVTFHGPGQLVAYPIVRLNGMGPREWVSLLEEAVIAAVSRFDVPAHRDAAGRGVWVGDRKLCAIGVRINRGVSMHGLALNISTDLSNFDAIVPCGIEGKGVTSLESERQELVDPRDVEAALSAELARLLHVATDLDLPLPTDGYRSALDRRKTADDAAPGDRRPRAADGNLRPRSLRASIQLGRGYRSVRSVVERNAVNTVCEEASCPNVSDCWARGTATLMVLGTECTRACGFCDVSTSKPLPRDPDEPRRIGATVRSLRLRHAVITSVARDDLFDGGASHFAECIREIRRERPGCTVEVLVPDFKGDPEALRTVIEARPDVLNHNLETVARLQKEVRPSAGYARSLVLLARARELSSEIITKSGVMVGLGETYDEIHATVADIAAVGVQILTIGQYLPPSGDHLPVSRWYTPDEFANLRRLAKAEGIEIVESGGLVRSSYRAESAVEAIRSRSSAADMSRGRIPSRSHHVALG